MTKEISTDAELMSRLLTTQPTPAECLVAAARIEQLATTLAAERAKVEAVIRIAASLFPGGYDNNHARICAAITEAGQ